MTSRYWVLAIASGIAAASLQAQAPAAQGTTNQTGTASSTTNCQADSSSLQCWVASQIKASAAQNTTKQTQSISIDHGSTAFVDQSSGSDLASSGLNLLSAGSGNAGSDPGSGTATVSYYSLYALRQKINPLDPANYNAHPGMRTLFFTLGREQSATTTSSTTTTNSSTTATATAGSPTSKATTGTSSSSTSTSSSSTTPGTVYGLQWIPVNRRDATSIAADPALMTQLETLLRNQFAPGELANYAALGKLFCPQETGAARTECENGLNKNVDAINTAYNKLSAADQKEAKDLINKSAQANADANKAFQDWVTQLQHRLQVAFSFQAIQRSGTSPSDYKGELIVDGGFGKHLFATFNGSYDYSNSPLVGADVRTERGAVQFAYNPSPSRAKSGFFRQFNISGEGLRQEKTWHYRAQAQYVLGISSGIDLPLSIGYADQKTVLQQEEKGVYGKFGFTFDFSKIIAAIKGQQ